MAADEVALLNCSCLLAESYSFQEIGRVAELYAEHLLAVEIRRQWRGNTAHVFELNEDVYWDNNPVEAAFINLDRVLSYELCRIFTS